MDKIESKYLEGIKMTGSTEKIVEKDGRKTATYIPWERQAKEEDVLKYEDFPDHVHIVIKDGRKYDPSKKEKKEEKGK